jgi:hypothetical protein
MFRLRGRCGSTRRIDADVNRLGKRDDAAVGADFRGHILAIRHAFIARPQADQDRRSRKLSPQPANEKPQAADAAARFDRGDAHQADIAGLERGDRGAPPNICCTRENGTLFLARR